MMHRGFLTCALLGLSLPGWCQQFEDNSALIATAQTQMMQTLANEYQGVEPNNIKVEISPLDPRTRLGKCDGNITQAIASQRPYGSNLSLKLQCSGSRPWMIYLPAKVETLASVAVLSKNLERGKILAADDFELALMNTAQVGFGYLSDPKQLIGMELKRRLPVGSTLRLSHIKIPEAVNRGDKVTLEAGIGGLSVVTNAKALASGKIGQQIQVVNLKSNRVVDAEVVGRGRVRVSM